VLRRIFGLKKDEVTGGLRKLHNEKLHNLYSSPIRMTKSRRMRCAGHVARMGEKWNTYRVLVGNPEVKRSQGRPRRMWVDTIKMDHRQIGWGCIGLDRSGSEYELVNVSCEYGNEPTGSIKCWKVLE
jgi:hypothetical protein